MKNVGYTNFALFIAAILGLVGCAAPGPATPAPRPPTPSATAPAAQQPLARPNPETQAWDKVVIEAKKEGKVTLYAFAFAGDIGTGLSRAFRERYGISVDIVTGRGNELIERLKTELRMGKVVGDFLETSNLNTLTAKDQGVVVAPGFLPVLQEKDVWLVPPALDPEGTVYSYVASPISLWINTNLVKPGDEPKAWKDLLEPRWKGKLLSLDPAVSSGPYLAFVPLLNNKVIDEAYLQALGRQDIVLDVQSTRELFKKLAAGQYPLFVGASGSTAGPIIMEGAPIRMIDMAEGVTVSGLGIAVVKNAPHPQAARLFMNWLMSPEGQTLQSKLQAAPPVRKDATDYTPAAAKLVPKRLIPSTQKDLDDATRLFREKYLVKVLKDR